MFICLFVVVVIATVVLLGVFVGLSVDISTWVRVMKREGDTKAIKQPTLHHSSVNHSSLFIHIKTRTVCLDIFSSTLFHINCVYCYLIMIIFHSERTVTVFLVYSAVRADTCTSLYF